MPSKSIWMMTPTEAFRAVTRKNINSPNRRGLNAFIEMIESGDLSKAEQAILFGEADLDFRIQKQGVISRFDNPHPYEIGATPLHVAALLGHWSIVSDILFKTLLTRSAVKQRVNIRDDEGLSVLDYALYGYERSVMNLEKKEAHPIRGAFTRRAKLEERKKAYANIIWILLEEGAENYVKDLPESFKAKLTVGTKNALPDSGP